MKKILHLTLTRSPFARIVNGQKRMEYRQIKPYWEKRLRNRDYHEIVFRNGYSKGVPEIRIECLGIVQLDLVADPPYYNAWKENYMGACFGIRLGKILELKNCECLTQSPQSQPTSSHSSRASLSSN